MTTYNNNSKAGRATIASLINSIQCAEMMAVSLNEQGNSQRHAHWKAAELIAVKTLRDVHGIDLVAYTKIDNAITPLPIEARITYWQDCEKLLKALDNKAESDQASTDQIEYLTRVS